MFSKEEIAQVKPCYEAIKVIAERQKCSRCKGWGRTYDQFDELEDCWKCHRTGKLKWEWKPEVGETLIFEDGSAHQVVMICYHSPKDRRAQILQVEWPWRPVDAPKNSIPLLHWERIRKILKQFDYSFSITSGASGGEITVYKAIGTDKLYEKYHNNNLQLEVMQAVIELGKEKQ